MNWLLYIGGAGVIFLSVGLAVGVETKEDFKAVIVAAIPFLLIWTWLMWKFMANH
jgi:hypothetical protein